jgi:WD40 repeat protein
MIRLWNLQSAEPVAMLAGHKDTSTTSSHCTHTLLILHSHSTHTGHKDTINYVRFDAMHGQLITASDDGTCRVWSKQDWERSSEAQQRRNEVQCRA